MKKPDENTKKAFEVIRDLEGIYQAPGAAVAEIEALLALDVNPSSKNDDGDTLLHVAVNLGVDPNLVRVLLVAGANPTIPNSRGESALKIAEDAGLNEEAELMRPYVEAAALEEEEPSEYVDIDVVEEYGTESETEEESSEYVDIDVVEEYGTEEETEKEEDINEFLIAELQKGRKEWDREKIAEYMEAGADFSTTDPEGNTYLHLIAKSQGMSKGIDEFIKNGENVDINAQNNAGQTATMRALSLGNGIALHTLLDRGAAVNIADQNGKTLSDYAKEVEGDPDYLAVNDALQQFGILEKKEEPPKPKEKEEEVSEVVSEEVSEKEKTVDEILWEELNQPGLVQWNNDVIMDCVRKGADLSNGVIYKLLSEQKLRNNFTEILTYAKEGDVAHRDRINGMTAADKAYLRGWAGPLKAMLDHDPHLMVHGNAGSKAVLKLAKERYKMLKSIDDKPNLVIQVFDAMKGDKLKSIEITDKLVKDENFRNQLNGEMNWTAYQKSRIETDDLKGVAMVILQVHKDENTFDINAYPENVQKALFNVVAYAGKLSQESEKMHKDEVDPQSAKALNMSTKYDAAQQLIEGIMTSENVEELIEKTETALKDQTFTQSRGTGFYKLHSLFAKKRNDYSTDRHHVVRSTLEELTVDLHKALEDHRDQPTLDLSQ